MMLQIPRRWLPWLVCGSMVVPSTMAWAILTKEGHPGWIALIVPTLFVVVVLPLVRGMLWMMGWDRLARRYPMDLRTAPRQPAWSETIASIALGKPWAFLNNCVRHACDAEALTLAIEHPFRLGTPTIRLPWSELGTPVAVPGHKGLMEVVDKHGSPLVVRVFVPEELLTPRNKPQPER